jgi:hypothetical protein
MSAQTLCVRIAASVTDGPSCVKKEVVSDGFADDELFTAVMMDWL